MNLQTPPANATFEALFESVNEHSVREGYAVTIKRSKKNKKKALRKAWLQCDKGGKYKSKGAGIRQSLSRRDDYSFEVIAPRDLDLETWTFIVKNSEHNHIPFLPGAQKVHRKAAITEDAK